MPPSVLSGTTFWRSCMESPWYNRTGWLGVKHQFTSYMELHTTYKAHWLRKVASVILIIGPIKHYRGERVPGKLQALVYDIRNSFGGRRRKAMLWVWEPGSARFVSVKLLWRLFGGNALPPKDSYTPTEVCFCSVSEPRFTEHESRHGTTAIASDKTYIPCLAFQAGVADEFSSPGSTFCADSRVIQKSVPPRGTAVARKLKSPLLCWKCSLQQTRIHLVCGFEWSDTVNWCMVVWCIQQNANWPRQQFQVSRSGISHVTTKSLSGALVAYTTSVDIQTHYKRATVTSESQGGGGAGIAQWLEHRTRDWKVAGSNPCWNGGRIFFSRVDFLCWLLFRYPFHPRVTTVARKKSRSFCQKVQVAGYS